MIRRYWAVIAVALGALAVASAARAESPGSRVQVPVNASTATCAVYEIEASNDDGGIDGRLSKLKAKLQRPPFSSWKTFKLLQRHDVTLQLKKPVGISLATGGKLTLLFRDTSGDAGKPRMRLNVTLDDKSGQRIVEATSLLASGDDWLIGGEKLPNEKSYILGINCSL